MDNKVKTLHALYSGQQTLCHYWLRRFVRKTFCKDRFKQHFSHADRLTFCQEDVLSGPSYGWSRVVMGGYG